MGRDGIITLDISPQPQRTEVQPNQAQEAAAAWEELASQELPILGETEADIGLEGEKEAEAAHAA